MFDEFLADAYELLIRAGWVDQDPEGSGPVKLRHPAAAPADASVSEAFAVMFIWAGSAAPDMVA